MARAERWIVRRQEADGSWGGIQPPWVYSLIALHLRGYPIDHPVIRAGLDGLERFTIHEPDSQRLEACQSPVWDTALAVVALADAGVQLATTPALIAGRRTGCSTSRSRSCRATWAVRRPRHETERLGVRVRQRLLPRRRRHDRGRARAQGCQASGPEPERIVERDPSPRMTGSRECRTRAAAGRRSMPRTPSASLRSLPFCDFGEVIDPPSADVTRGTHDRDARRRRATAITMASRHAPRTRVAERRAGARRLVVRALGRQPHLRDRRGAAGADRRRAYRGPTLVDVRRAVRWLERHQNPDGGWGEDIRSYVGTRNGSGAARARRRRPRGRCWRSTRPASGQARRRRPRRRSGSRGHATSKTGAGMSGVHRHRLPV